MEGTAAEEDGEGGDGGRGEGLRAGGEDESGDEGRRAQDCEIS